MNHNEIEQFYRQQYEWTMDYPPPAAYMQEEVARVKQLIGHPQGNVLELGAGTGWFAKAFASFSKTYTAVEYVQVLAEAARQNAPDNLLVQQDDFYTIALDGPFDTILYLDGFGVGTDEQQVALLRRMEVWLARNGRIIIDVYQPNYWQAMHGFEMDPLGTGVIERRYTYDASKEVMRDTWWRVDQPNVTTTQTLACYSPSAFEQLAKQAGLQVIDASSNGGFNLTTGQFEEERPLEDSLSIRFVLEKCK